MSASVATRAKPRAPQPALRIISALPPPRRRPPAAALWPPAALAPTCVDPGRERAGTRAPRRREDTAGVAGRLPVSRCTPARCAPAGRARACRPSCPRCTRHASPLPATPPRRPRLRTLRARGLASRARGACSRALGAEGGVLGAEGGRPSPPLSAPRRATRASVPLFPSRGCRAREGGSARHGGTLPYRNASGAPHEDLSLSHGRGAYLAGSLSRCEMILMRPRRHTGCAQ